MSTVVRLLTWQMEEAKIAKALQTLIGCVTRDSLVQLDPAAHREVVVRHDETMWTAANGVVETQLPVDVEEQWKTCITLWCGAPPCTAIEMLCNMMWCQGAVRVREPQMYACWCGSVTASHLLVI